MYSSVYQKIWARLGIISLFVYTIFFTSCSPSSDRRFTRDLSKEEIKDLEFFLNYLLFENHGAFVLFGSKPISEVALFDLEKAEASWEKQLASMSDEARKKLLLELEEHEKKGLVFYPKWPRNPYKGWLAFQKIRNSSSKNRFLIVVDSAEKKISCDLYLVDIPKTAAVLAKHYEYFKRITGMDFDPLAIVYEMEDKKSSFWKSVFNVENHFAKGVLFGYGTKNAHFYAHQVKHGELQNPISKSIMALSFPTWDKEEREFASSNLKNFTIPLFGAIDTDRAEKYKKEKKMIEKHFHRKNMISTALEKLLD